MSTPDELQTIEIARQFIAEMAGGLVAHAGVIRTYAEFGNDPGLLYSARCSAAYLRALQAGIVELERCRAFKSYQRNATKLGPSAFLPDGDV